MSAERRQFARIHFNVEARFACAGKSANVRVLDLSFKGALVDAPFAASLKAGSSCILTVPLGSSDAAHQITMSANVAHIKGTQLGLRCRSIDLDSMTHLRHLIQLNLGDPHLLERDLKALVSA